MKILVAVDGSECSAEAARSVAMRPWPEGSEIRVMSAYELASMVAMPEVGGAPPDIYERVTRNAREAARKAVDEAAGVISSASGAPPVTTTTIEGYPKEAILDEAERWGADLIVVGSHGYRGLKRLWLGSVSQAVASHAECSVLIVRSPRQKS